MMKLEELIKDNSISMGEAIERFEEIAETTDTDIVEAIGLDYFKAFKKEQCPFDDWKKTPNLIVMTKGFLSLFEDIMTSYLVVYLSIQLLMECSGNGITGYLQTFSFEGIEYWITCEQHGVTVLLPEEY